MEPGSKKRKLQSGPADNKKSGKRTKTGNNRPAAKAKKGRPTAGFRKMDATSLPWKEDPDGMMGLEMIDGVDVVREGENVEFFMPEALAEAAGGDNNDDDDEEFEGFDDLPEAENEGGISSQTAAADDTKDKEDKEEEEEKEGSAEEDSEAEDTADGGAPVSANDAPDTDVSAWESLGISQPMLSAIANLKFSKPTAIQSAAIPEILAGHDVIGKASTGSGKTLAFAIPMIEKWLKSRDEPADPEKETAEKIPTALILSPTRELAKQLTEHIKAVSAGLKTRPYVCSVTGGLSILKQQRQLAKADIVIATPGRLWEVINSDIPLLQAFKQIRLLAVDEADRLLSEGHFKEAEHILDALDREEMGFEEGEGEDSEDNEEQSPRQTLVFSATFNKGLQQKLAGKGKFNLMKQDESMEYLLQKLKFREETPKFIDVNPVSQMAENLKEGMVECGGQEKDLFLYAVLLLNPVNKTLVFTNSIAAVRRLSPLLQNLQLKVHPLHSQMPQKARHRSIERFTAATANESTILLCTDVAARGLDIPNVDQVIHYHVPRAADAYVHRSGRTARAEKSGLSILLCAPEEVTPTRRLVAKVHHEKAASKKFFIRTIDIDRRVVAKLKPRVALAKQIADAAIAKDKNSKEDSWMKTAAEELGVEYDSEDMEKAKIWGGKGSGKKRKEMEVAGLSKAEVGALKAQLRELLSQRVNTGVSERYITGGRVDIEALLRGEGSEDFLGKVDALIDEA